MFSLSLLLVVECSLWTVDCAALHNLLHVTMRNLPADILARVLVCHCLVCHLTLTSGISSLLVLPNPFTNESLALLGHMLNDLSKELEYLVSWRRQIDMDQLQPKHDFDQTSLKQFFVSRRTYVALQRLTDELYCKFLRNCCSPCELASKLLSNIALSET